MGGSRDSLVQDPVLLCQSVERIVVLALHAHRNEQDHDQRRVVNTGVHLTTQRPPRCSTALACPLAQPGALADAPQGLQCSVCAQATTALSMERITTALSMERMRHDTRSHTTTTKRCARHMSTYHRAECAAECVRGGLAGRAKRLRVDL
jgi:hypothetical protein